MRLLCLLLHIVIACLSVDLAIQQAMPMRRIILSSVASLTALIFPHYNSTVQVVLEEKMNLGRNG